MRHVNRSFGLSMALGASALVVTGCPGPAPAPTSIAVTTTADVVDANDGVVSLREAVTKAAQDGADSTISLDGAAEYALTRCDLGAPIHSADQTVSITTDDGSRATIRQTCAQGQVLRFTGGAVELSHLVVRGGRLGSGVNCSWPTNPACKRGAGIETTARITLTDIEMTDNLADLGPGGTQGGALAAMAGATIRDSSFHDNRSDRWGGAIVSSAPLVVERSSFVANHALEGNAIASESGGADITDTLFENNTGGSGGAIVIRGGMLVLADSVLRGNNSGGGPGAAVWFSGGMTLVRIERTEVVDNTGRAGALTSQGVADYRIVDSTITGNVATMAIRDQYNASAGAIAIGGQATVTVDRSTISSNSAPAGGGANIDVVPNTTTAFAFTDSEVSDPLGGGPNCSLRSGSATFASSFVSDASCGVVGAG